jgi:hypothetical protein
LLLWSPVIVEVLTNAPDNLSRTITWFQEADAGTHTLVEGWRIIASQFGGAPEWVTGPGPLHWASGEPAAIVRSPVPWLLLPLVGAALVFRRVRSGDGVRLVAVVGVAFLLAVAAVARTVGPAFAYRLRWTWAVGAIALVPILWAGWTLASRSGAVRRALSVSAIVVVGVCSGMSTVVAAKGETPMLPDSVVLAQLAPLVIAALEGVDGQVLVDDGPYDISSEYSRGLLLELERWGLDARMTSQEELLVGDHRVVNGLVAAEVVVAQDGEIDVRDDDARLRRVARWTSVTEEQRRAVMEQQASIDRAVRAGRLGPVEAMYELARSNLGAYDPAVAWSVAVYVRR